MPNGTIQDSRQHNDDPTHIRYGYLKVQDRTNGDPTNCDWNEYVLYIDPRRRNVPRPNHVQYEIVDAEIRYDGHTIPVKIAKIMRRRSILDLDYVLTHLYQESPEKFKKLTGLDDITDE